MTFPKQMRWDAYLEDGKGDLVFARPIRWLRAPVRRARRAVRHPAHRARAGPDRAGHPVGREHLRPPLPDDERPRRPGHQGQDVRRLRGAAARELRHPRARASASRRSRASSRRTPASSAARVQRPASRRSRRCCRKCRTSSSTRRSSPATSRSEFLQLPEEVLTTTMIHHQHYFPVVDDDGQAEAGVPGGHQHAGRRSRRSSRATPSAC